MPDLVSQLRVGGVVYTIQTGTEDVRLAKQGILGETDHQERRIVLCGDVPWMQQRDTLFHEIIHAVARHTNLDRAWGDHGEDYVERLETALLMVFTDNPGVVRLLLPEELPEAPTKGQDFVESTLRQVGLAV